MEYISLKYIKNNIKIYQLKYLRIPWKNSYKHKRVLHLAAIFRILIILCYVTSKQTPTFLKTVKIAHHRAIRKITHPSENT